MMKPFTVYPKQSISSQAEGSNGSPVTIVSHALILILACMLSVCGCLGTYGTLRSDPGVTRMLATGNALPDYHYYYTGLADAPLAVIGIAPEYSLKSRFWHPIQTRAEVAAMVARTGCRLRDNPVGFRMLDASGNQVGFWYSHIHNAVIQPGENNEIDVYAPNLGSLRGNRRNDGHPFLFLNAR